MKLNETEKNVSLVATKETAEEIKKRGMIIVEGITEIQNEIKIDDGISNADWHILAVKNYHLDDIIPELKKYKSERPETENTQSPKTPETSVSPTLNLIWCNCVRH